MQKCCAVIVFLLSALTLIATAAPAEKHARSAGFGIYLLKDPQLSLGDAERFELSQLELESEPWLSDVDISFYDYSTHCIYLKRDKNHLIENADRLFLFPTSIAMRPFAVVAEGEACYLGTFHTLVSSLAPIGPHIDEYAFTAYPSDILPILRGWSVGEDTQDGRDDPRIEASLKRLGIFHGGLSIELESVEVLERGREGTTLAYSISLTNGDTDALYAMDPAKMGDAFYHHSYGIELRSVDDPSRYYFKPSVESRKIQWSPDWLTRVAPGESIEHELTKRTAEPVAPGRYRCYMRFSGHQMSRNERFRPDGRIWIGVIRSNPVELIVRD